MSGQVVPLHFITVEFRLYAETEDSRIIKTEGQHRFLYGVESWIDGIDQMLDGLSEGGRMELLLAPEAAEIVANHLSGQDDFSASEGRLTLELSIIDVAKAEPREVTRALAATVKCCDHCREH